MDTWFWRQIKCDVLKVEVTTIVLVISSTQDSQYTKRSLTDAECQGSKHCVLKNPCAIRGISEYTSYNVCLHMVQNCCYYLLSPIQDWSTRLGARAGEHTTACVQSCVFICIVRFTPRKFLLDR